MTHFLTGFLEYIMKPRDSGGYIYNVISISKLKGKSRMDRAQHPWTTVFI